MGMILRFVLRRLLPSIRQEAREAGELHGRRGRNELEWVNERGKPLGSRRRRSKRLKRRKLRESVQLAREAAKIARRTARF